MSARSPSNAPSLQHLVAVLDPTSPDRTAKAIIRLRDGGGGTVRVFEAREYVGLSVSGEYDRCWIERQAQRIPNVHLRATALECIPLAYDLKEQLGIRWFRKIEPQVLPFTQSVNIPINPLGVVGTDEKTYVLWPQVWKRKTLTAPQFNLACGIMKRRLINTNPDFDDLAWAEMSAPGGGNRELQLRTLEAASLPSDEEMRTAAETLDAAMMIANAVPRKGRPQRPKSDRNQKPFDF